jgi:hypothetical protein
MWWRLGVAGSIILEMLPFCLYSAAGVVTGFHVCTLLVLAVHGAPSNPLELISLLGSLCLLIAAYISIFNPHLAAKFALLACLAMWCFYGPAIAKSIRNKFENRSSVLPDQSLFLSLQFRRQQATSAFSSEPQPSLVLARSFASTQGLCSESR